MNTCWERYLTRRQTSICCRSIYTSFQNYDSKLQRTADSKSKSVPTLQECLPNNLLPAHDHLNYRGPLGFGETHSKRSIHQSPSIGSLHNSLLFLCNSSDPQKVIKLDENCGSQICSLNSSNTPPQTFHHPISRLLQQDRLVPPARRICWYTGSWPAAPSNK